MSVKFGNAEALYNHLAKFVTRSDTAVIHGEKSFTIHHTQYASYNLQEVFTTIIEQTTSDPRDIDGNFSDEIQKAVKETTAYMERPLRNHYTNREYVDDRDVSIQASEYAIEANQDDRYGGMCHPQANSRRAAIAEVLSLYHASVAAREMMVLSNRETKHLNNNNDDELLNSEVVPAEFSVAVKHVVSHNGDRSPLSRPDPSLQTVEELFTIFKEVGLEPSVRFFYALLVDPSRPSFYDYRDASMNAVMSSVNRTMFGQTEYGKWTSSNEPPLSTIMKSNND